MAIMSGFRAGDWVEVKTREEILKTLDKTGRLEGLPFMPQMFKFCGKRFQIYKSAHKTCDTITGKADGRKLPGGIHLDLRCDGEAYGGCQAACLIFWKRDWLKPVSENGTTPPAAVDAMATPGSGCTEADVMRATTANGRDEGTATRYVCQATEMLNYTSLLKWYDARQYVEDYRSRNETLGDIVRGAIYVTYYYGSLSYRGRPGIPGRWLYNKFQQWRGGVPFPRSSGLIPVGQPTPDSNLNLQAGDLVRIKSFEEIRNTIDKHERNRNMSFDAELVPFCGGTYRVKTRVNTFIDEKTGKMKTLKTPAVILEDVFCKARYSYCRMFCPRAIHSWWREVWLERVSK
jgi:hypothetical protein